MLIFSAVKFLGIFSQRLEGAESIRVGKKNMLDDQYVFFQLKFSVQALAASAGDQVTLFPALTCFACELLGDYENWYGASIWREALGITENQRKSLDNLMNCIVEMEPHYCFKKSELYEKRDWEILRNLATKCLTEFGWPKELPPDGRSVYVKGK